VDSGGTTDHPLLAQDKDNKTVLMWTIITCRPAAVISRILSMEPRAATLCSWSGDTPVHALVNSVLFMEEAVVHADAAIVTEEGTLRKSAGRSDNEMLEVLHQIVELWPSAAYVRNSTGQTPIDLVCDALCVVVI